MDLLVLVRVSFQLVLARSLVEVAIQRLDPRALAAGGKILNQLTLARVSFQPVLARSLVEVAIPKLVPRAQAAGEKISVPLKTIREWESMVVQ
jgi:hypothetical protein